MQVNGNRVSKYSLRADMKGTYQVRQRNEDYTEREIKHEIIPPTALTFKPEIGRYTEYRKTHGS
jgi:hypothetical protein